MGRGVGGPGPRKRRVRDADAEARLVEAALRAGRRLQSVHVHHPPSAADGARRRLRESARRSSLPRLAAAAPCLNRTPAPGPARPARGAAVTRAGGGRRGGYVHKVHSGDLYNLNFAAPVSLPAPLTCLSL